MRKDQLKVVLKDNNSSNPFIIVGISINDFLDIFPNKVVTIRSDISEKDLHKTYLHKTGEYTPKWFNEVNKDEVKYLLIKNLDEVSIVEQ